MRVIVLYRDPVEAIMSMNNRGLPKIWRRFGRTFKLHKQVDLYLRQLDVMYAQLGHLHPDEYRVLNYTDLLINSQDHSQELSAFLQVPEHQLRRAFLLSIKAKPKKHTANSAATAAAAAAAADAPVVPDGTESAKWSDAQRRAFVELRLRERANSSNCCGEWLEALRGSKVARLRHSKPQLRRRHWFSEWAETAPPPLRAQQVSFTHVINPFDAGEADEEHRRVSHPPPPEAIPS